MLLSKDLGQFVSLQTVDEPLNQEYLPRDDASEAERWGQLSQKEIDDLMERDGLV